MEDINVHGRFLDKVKECRNFLSYFSKSWFRHRRSLGKFKILSEHAQETFSVNSLCYIVIAGLIHEFHVIFHVI